LILPLAIFLKAPPRLRGARPQPDLH
jgi:hypothetical protein